MQRQQRWRLCSRLWHLSGMPIRLKNSTIIPSTPRLAFAPPRSLSSSASDCWRCGQTGWVGQLGSLGVGGTLARRLFPAVIVTPLLLGWVLLQLDRLLGINPDFPLALFAVALVPVLCALVLWVARVLDALDQRRRSVEQALRKAKVEAEQATIAKSQFLASVSHDLRQPVQSLVLFMALLGSACSNSRRRTFSPPPSRCWMG